LSKVLEASCEESVVEVEGEELDAAQTEIISEGIGASEGIVLLQGGKAYYLAKTSGDLKTTLQKLTAALEKISDALGNIDSAGYLIAATGGVPGVPLNAANISAIDSAKSDLDDLLGALK
jgi:hypothetical protein